MGSAATGARLGIVTPTACSTDRPPGSVAVTVTFAVPSVTAVMVPVEPATLTRATPASDDTAE